MQKQHQRFLATILLFGLLLQSCGGSHQLSVNNDGKERAPTARERSEASPVCCPEKSGGANSPINSAVHFPQPTHRAPALPLRGAPRYAQHQPLHTKSNLPTTTALGILTALGTITAFGGERVTFSQDGQKAIVTESAGHTRELPVMCMEGHSVADLVNYLPLLRKHYVYVHTDALATGKKRVVCVGKRGLRGGMKKNPAPNTHHNSQGSAKSLLLSASTSSSPFGAHTNVNSLLPGLAGICSGQAALAGPLIIFPLP